MKKTNGKYKVVVDRKEAIKEAIEMATYQGKIRETCEIRKARLTNDKNKAEID